MIDIYVHRFTSFRRPSHCWRIVAQRRTCQQTRGRVRRRVVRHCLLAGLFEGFAEGVIVGGAPVDDLGRGGGAHAPVGAGEVDFAFG